MTCSFVRTDNSHAVIAMTSRETPLSSSYTERIKKNKLFGLRIGLDEAILILIYRVAKKSIKCVKTARHNRTTDVSCDLGKVWNACLRII